MNRTIYSGQRIPRDRLVLPSEEYYRRRYRGSQRGRWLLLIVTLLAVCTAAVGSRAAQPAAQGSAQEVSLDQVHSGDLLFSGSAPGGYVPAVHLHSRAHIAIRGLLAEVRLDQAFVNRSDDWREAVYVLPLPDQAAVNGLQIRIGERRIVGQVRERQQAAKIYRAARQAGKRAALLEQQRPNLFTSRVANIAPGETVLVQIRYLQPVNYDSGRFSLRLPTTLTPRYIPGAVTGVMKGDGTKNAAAETGLATNDEGWALPTDQVPDAHRITPFMVPAGELSAHGSHKITIEVALDGGLPLADISSPYHDIDVTRQADGSYSIALRHGAASMDRDFALYWRPRAASMPRAALFTEKGKPSKDPATAATYLQLLLLPPDAEGHVRRLSREVIYVIDTSGSMGGNSIRQARKSLLLALSRLHSGDRFNVIEFNSTTRAFFPHPVDASPANIQQARAQVAALQARGGTEMAPALRLALSQQKAGDDTMVQQVVFITDGAVGNERALFRLIRQNLDSVRLFTVGIGSAPNSHFMRKAAQFGRGASVTIGDLGEVQEKMQALFAMLESPLATDLKIQWPAGLKVDAYPQRIPDLYRGQPLQLVARVEGDLHGQVQLRGRLAGKQFVRMLTLASASAKAGGDGHGKGIGSLWARAKIDALRDRQMRSGEQSDAGQALRERILKLALAHQLASPYTSFVAVEEAPVRPGTEALVKSPVVNAVPRGQVLQRLAYPRTAAGLRAQLLSAATLLGLAALLARGRLLRRRQGLMTRLRRLLRRLFPRPGISAHWPRSQLERALLGNGRRGG